MRGSCFRLGSYVLCAVTALGCAEGTMNPRSKAPSAATPAPAEDQQNALAIGAAVVWSVARARWRWRLARVEAQQAMERERRRIARDLHDDLGSDLTEIMLLGESAGARVERGVR